MTGPRLNDQDMERLYQEWQASKATDAPDPFKPTTPSVKPDATKVVNGKPTGETYWNDPVQIMRAGANGALLNYGDEAEAGIRSMLPKSIGGGDYGPLLADIRGQNKQYANEHPIADLLAKLGGGAMTGGLVAKAIGGAPAAAEGLSTAAKIGHAMKTGAKVGAIAGGVAGSGAGETMGERVGGAAVGAGFGGLLGGALSGAGETIANADKVAPWVRDMLGKTTGDEAKRRALQKLATDIENDGLSTDKLRETLAGVPEDVPYTILDVGAGNVKNRGAAVAAVPGKGQEVVRKALTDRRQGEGARLIDAFKSATGGTPDEINTTTAAMEAARGAAADKEYGAAREAGKFLLHPKYRELLDSPTIQKMYGDLTDRLAETGKQLTPIYDEVQIIGPNGPESALRVMDTPSVETLDYLYRDLRNKARSAFKRDDALVGKQFKYLANQVKSVLDDPNIGVPEYTQARQNFAKASEMIDARKTGYGLSTMQPEEISQTLGGMSDDAQTQARAGFMRDRYEKVRAASRTRPINKVDANPQMRDQNLEVAHPERRGDLSARLDAEHTMNQTHQATLVGSRTTPLAEGVKNLGGSEWEKVNTAIDALATPATKAGIMKQVKDAIQNRALVGRGQIAEELGNLMVKGAASRKDLSDLIDAIAGFKQSTAMVPYQPPMFGPTRTAALAGYTGGNAGAALMRNP